MGLEDGLVVKDLDNVIKVMKDDGYESQITDAVINTFNNSKAKEKNVTLRVSSGRTTVQMGRRGKKYNL